MTSEWRHVLPISVKKGCTGIVVSNTVFKIEPIGFQQSMQVENDYQIDISDFENFEDFENWKIFQFFSFSYFFIVFRDFQSLGYFP